MQQFQFDSTVYFDGWWRRNQFSAPNTQTQTDYTSTSNVVTLPGIDSLRCVAIAAKHYGAD